MNEKRRLVFSVAVIAVGILGLGAVWALGLRKASLLQAELGKVQDEMAQAEKRLGRLDELQRQSRDRAQLERRLVQMLPDTRGLERVYDVLEEIERQAGQTPGGSDFTLLEGKVVESKDKKKTGQPQDFEEILLEVGCAGSWAGFVSFIDGVEHADRLIAVRGFTSSKDDNKDGRSTGFKVLLGLYVLKEPVAEKPKPPAPPAKPS